MIESSTLGPMRDLAAELKRQLETKRDLMADTRRVSLIGRYEEDDDEVVKQPVQMYVDLADGVEEFAIADHAHGQLATHLGVGRQLWDRLNGDHPDLLANLANGLFTREPHKRMLRTLDGRVRAFLSNKYRPRDNWDLVETSILPVLEEHTGLVSFKKCDLTETRMYIKIELPEFERDVKTAKVNDVIHGGVIIQNSEVGAGSLGVYPYTTVLRCLNGMVHTEYGQKRRHVGKRITGEEEAWEIYSDETLKLDDEAFFAKCRDTLRAVLNETVFDAIVAQMQDLAGVKVSGPPDKVVEVFSKKHTLREGERGSMLEALVDVGDLSAWGYLNALTQTARDIEDADRQVELEKLAGRLMEDADSFALVNA